MNSPRHIPATEILEISAQRPVTVQGEGMDVFDGVPFSSDEAAVRFTGEERQGMHSKIDIPLGLAMEGAFRTVDPAAARSRLGLSPEVEALIQSVGTAVADPPKEFRLVLPDREIVPRNIRGIRAVMPYVLHYGMTSLVLDVSEEGVKKESDEHAFGDDPLWLNVLEPDAPQAIQAHMPTVNLQLFINANELPADELLARYLALRTEAGEILERVVNSPLATG